MRNPARTCSECINTKQAAETAEPSDPLKENLRQIIGQRIAIDAARREIIEHAKPVTTRDDDRWWDTCKTVPEDADTQFRVNRAATFLDLCGLLDRMGSAPHIVAIKVEAITA